nr:MAG TPA: hypothetical protein [Caudoviricetes sp.]
MVGIPGGLKQFIDSCAKNANSYFVDCLASVSATNA